MAGMQRCLRYCRQTIFCKAQQSECASSSNLAAWLRIAPDNLQILCLSQPVDIEQYTRRMEGFLQSEGDALCRTCIEDNINEVNSWCGTGHLYTVLYSLSV